jgi:transketolase
MLNKLNINTAKKRLLKMHFESEVGHIGGNLSCLDCMMIVFHEYLRDDDEFILSKGHSAGALYITLWTVGCLQDADLLKFHKNDTFLGGHPPTSGIKRVLFATGSLGHGISLSAGTALAFNLKNEGRNVYCLASDGELQEGSSWEAIIFIAHQQLANLTVLVDCNGLQGFGTTAEVASMSGLEDKLSGFNLHVISINGHSLSEIRNALNVNTNRPKVILLNTLKGNGISFMENKMEWHYLPLSHTLYELAIKELDF